MTTTQHQASGQETGCVFCGPTLAQGDSAPARGEPVPYRGVGYLSCTRVPYHAGPCIACGVDENGFAASREEVTP